MIDYILLLAAPQNKELQCALGFKRLFHSAALSSLPVTFRRERASCGQPLRPAIPPGCRPRLPGIALPAGLGSCKCCWECKPSCRREAFAPRQRWPRLSLCPGQPEGRGITQTQFKTGQRMCRASHSQSLLGRKREHFRISSQNLCKECIPPDGAGPAWTAPPPRRTPRPSCCFLSASGPV